MYSVLSFLVHGLYRHLIGFQIMTEKIVLVLLKTVQWHCMHVNHVRCTTFNNRIVTIQVIILLDVSFASGIKNIFFGFYPYPYTDVC